MCVYCIEKTNLKPMSESLSIYDLSLSLSSLYTSKSCKCFVSVQFPLKMSSMRNDFFLFFFLGHNFLADEKHSPTMFLLFPNFISFFLYMEKKIGLGFAQIALDLYSHDIFTNFFFLFLYITYCTPSGGR